jgi:hypothetical protein
VAGPSSYLPKETAVRISTSQTDNGKSQYLIELDGTENAEFQDILDGWLDALEYHEYKSRGYKRRDLFSLGIKGEFVGFWRKAQKLLPLIWEAKTLTGEGTQEVLMDTFGSVGLMLHALREHSDKYSARWRANHGNKPTFGPGPDVPASLKLSYSGGAPSIPLRRDRCNVADDGVHVPNEFDHCAHCGAAIP